MTIKAAMGPRWNEDNMTTPEQWMIDGTINLTDACTRAGWHVATAVDALVARGIARQDAESFVAFRFALEAARTEARPEDELTDEQWRRLT